MGMWVGPGATADHWGLAHEFMHARAIADAAGSRAAAPRQQLLRLDLREPRQLRARSSCPSTDDDVHCSEMLVNAPHLYLGSTRDRYCNWQFMEYLKDKYCYGAVNDIWTSADAEQRSVHQHRERRAAGDVGQLNDFFGEWAMHNVTWDYRDPPPDRRNRALFRAQLRQDHRHVQARAAPAH